MKRKHKKYPVKLWDKKLRKAYYKILSAISVVVTLLSIKPVSSIEDGINNPYVWEIILIIYFVLLVVAYIVMWICANERKKISLDINGNVLEIRHGSIFEEPSDVWKVVNANEYFDTELGGKGSLVSAESVEGKYLRKFYATGTMELDERIREQLSCVQGRKKKQRRRGKEIKYPLGTIFCDMKDNRKYLLTAFARMDDANRAYLSMKDYVNFLMNFWEEIDKVYDGHSITISLFGTGIVRLDKSDVSPQELLELIVWSFRNSHIKLAYGAKVTVLLYGEVADRINLYNLI